jgi:3'-5' exoribonuclease 1
MNYIIYDLECTCWEDKSDSAGQVMETIEIGALKLNEYGEVMGTFSQLIRPKIHPVLSDFCQRLTSISQIEVNRAESFTRVINDFMDFIELEEDNYWLCSWGNFDKKQLEKDCILHDIEVAWLDFHINIKQDYLKLKGFRQPIGLKKAVLREGFEFTGTHHRALADSENTAKIFVKYLDVWQR